MRNLHLIKANDSQTNLYDLNDHLNLENPVITEDVVQRFLNKTPQPIFFERLHDVTLSRSQYRVTTFIALAHTKIPFLH